MNDRRSAVRTKADAIADRAFDSLKSAVLEINRETPGTSLAISITKRELFAALLLQGILASGSGGDAHTKVVGAVKYADDLALELKETESK